MRPSLGISDLPTDKVIYPDVGVIRSRMSEVAAAPYAAVATPDAEVETMGEEVPVTWVEIRDVAERRLVTVIEILSPVNKLGEGYSEYCQRRELLARTQTHMLELDLLQRGQRLPSSKPLPPAPYYA